MADGKHQLLLELGRGGMGTVYLAVSRGPAGFSKLKVVKRLRADLASDEQFLKMFLDEARLTARLNHPNVVQTNEVGFDGAHYFIEMEYLEGQSLDALGRRAMKSGGLPIELSLYILAQSLSGLHYAHELKDHSGQALRIVHRDVSPHNVFVTYDGAVKVLDFGIAKAADSSTDTTTGVVKGKATYMAPEQAARGIVDRRADVFAVGVMLWETLTRKRMWTGLSDFEIFLSLQRGPPPPPRSAEPDVPEALDAICVKALAFAAADRFATAKEMQLAIEDVIATGSGRAGPGPLADRVGDLFAERRAAIGREIDARLKEFEGGGETSARTSVDVPVLGMAKGIVETSTGPTRSRGYAPDGEATKAAGPSARKLVAADEERAEGETEDAEESVAAGRGRTKSAVISDLPRAPARSRRVGRVLSIAMALVVVGGAAVYGLARPAHKSAAPTLSPEAPRCKANADCRGDAGAGQMRCVPASGKCVPFESGECKAYASAEAKADDGTLWIGAMFPLSGPRGERYGVTAGNTLRLANTDFEVLNRPGRRRTGLVLCDDARDGTPSAQHLVDLGVPVVIGFVSTAEGADLVPHMFVPNHVLVLDVMTPNKAIAAAGKPADGPRLVWLTATTSDQFGEGVARAAGNVLEPLARQRDHLAPGAPIRIALARNGGAFSFSFADAFVSSLRFNGGTVVDNASYFRQFVFAQGDGSAPADEKIAEDLAAFQPNIVACVGTEDFYARILERVEERWPRSAARPIYVSATIPSGDPLHAFVGKSAERRHRFFGIDLPANTQANLKYVLRYNELFSPPITLGVAPGTVYDTFYMAAFAGSLGDPATAPVSLDVARAFSRYKVSGAPIEVGPSSIDEAVSLLRDGRDIDLHGAGFHAVLDEPSGEVSSAFAVYCLGVGADGVVGDAVESGITLAEGDGHAVGVNRCP